MALPGEQDPVLSSTHLEEGWLHKVLVAMNAPSGWPGWLIGVVALVPIVAVTGLWWWVIGEGSLYLALGLVFFTLSDALILLSLPYWRISFGPVGPQLFTLGLPRLGVAVLALVAANWLGPVPSLIGVMIINLGASLALVWGVWMEPKRLRISTVPLAHDSLHLDGRPLRLLHISDVHVERFGRREQQLLQWVKELSPDIIVFTGDYVNLSYVDDPVAHADARRLLEALAGTGNGPAPAGMFAVLGSPTVDRNSAPLFDGLPIRLLRDEVVVLELPVEDGVARKNRRLALIGLDCTHDAEWDAERLAAIVTQAPPDAFRLLLHHSPELMPVAPKYGIDLYLCGHTHGGQVRFPWYGAVVTSSRLGKRFEMGYYRLGRTHMYISRGVGLEGMGAPRVRFLCPPEIAMFSLNGNKDSAGEIGDTCA